MAGRIRSRLLPCPSDGRRIGTRPSTRRREEEGARDPMRVLVTGGAGFIGSHLLDRCVAAGHDVVVVDNLSTGRRELVNPAVRLSVIDLRSPGLADVFRAEAPNAVIHLAAQAEVRRSVERPLLDADVNIMGAVNLL